MFASRVTKPAAKAAKRPAVNLSGDGLRGTVEPSVSSDYELGLAGSGAKFGYDIGRVRIDSRLPGALGPEAKWSGLFGTDLSMVRLHPESSRAGGRIHAVTEGEDIYFAPRRFAPGTQQGDRLIAHELAHVTQLRRPGRPSPPLAAELDADAAAETGVRGQATRTHASLAAGKQYSYEAWEHRQLGDALGGADRKIRLPNGVELTYGQVVALSGDFYRSPEALLRAPRAELENILAVMDRERTLAAKSPTHAPSAADANTLNASYELATTGHSRGGSPVATLAGDSDTPAGLMGTLAGPHGEVREGEHVESGAPGAEAGFLDLAADNPAHFSPENIALNWIPKHQLALDLARQAWQNRNPRATPAPLVRGSHSSERDGTATGPVAAGLPATAAAAHSVATTRPDPAAVSTPAGVANADATASSAERNEAQAWLTSGFADHFLTDAFASGHLISGSTGRSICQSFFDTQSTAITFACWQCDIAEGADPARAAIIVPAIREIVKSRASSLLLKTVHDFYNRNGVEVQNALGQSWRTIGDAHLGNSPETAAMAGLASKASRDAVQDVLLTGGTTRADAALDYIPDTARLAGGTYRPIATFSSDPLVWNSVLARALSSSPASNDLYQLIKGNIEPMVSLMAQKGARSATSAAAAAARRAGDIAGSAVRGVEQQVEDLKRVPGRVEAEIRQLYGVPY